MAFGVAFPVLFALMGFVNADFLTFLYTSLIAEPAKQPAPERLRTVLQTMEETEPETLAEAALRVAS